MRYSPLLTDLYELTMIAGYYEQQMHEAPAVFDLFFRHNPYKGGYAVFAGLETALQYLETLRFSGDDLKYLEGLGIFKPAFLAYLEGFRFRGSVTAPREGTAVFAGEPLLTVEGALAEAQFVETALLNVINFQTLVATKAARITRAAHGAAVLEFGMRRAHGPDGALSVARAAYIGGVRHTSNVLAAKEFGIPPSGTHAHSWIMAFPDELTAFRNYAAIFPNHCTLLVDTYDTLKSGIPNAVKVAQEMRRAGHELGAVRLDSGDLAFLSREARQTFDKAGFPGVKIVASNEIDEYVIESIREDGGRVDIYGVGTKLATCGGEGGGALGGVYKLVRLGDQPKLKVTSDLAKATLPDRKRVLRAVAPDGTFIQDVIARYDEDLRPGATVFDPANPLQHKTLPLDTRFVDVRKEVMCGGKRCTPAATLEQAAGLWSRQAKLLPAGCERLVNPHTYKVSISTALHQLRMKLVAEIKRRL